MSALLKTYEPPELKDFGKVVELTLQDGASGIGSRRRRIRANRQARGERRDAYRERVQNHRRNRRRNRRG